MKNLFRAIGYALCVCLITGVVIGLLTGIGYLCAHYKVLGFTIVGVIVFAYLTCMCYICMDKD